MIIDIHGRQLFEGAVVLGSKDGKLYYGVIHRLILSTGAAEVELFHPSFAEQVTQIYIFPSTELLLISHIPREIADLIWK